MAELDGRVIEISGPNLRQVKERALQLPQVQSAAQQGLQLRILLRAAAQDPIAGLRAQLGDGTLSYAVTKPSLEDVFVASTHGGDGG